MEKNIDVKFKRVTKKDEKDFCDISICYFNDSVGYYPQEYIDGRIKDYETQENFFKRLSDPNANPYICYVDDKPMGKIVYGKSRDDDTSETDGEIWAISFYKHSHGKGYASMAMEFAENKLREMGCDKIYLWCLETNARARNFYENKHGYRPTNVQKILDLAGTPFNEIRFEKAVRK